MIKIDELPNGDLHPSQIEKWVQSLTEDMLVWRRACDVQIPNPTPLQVRQQRRNMWTFLSKQGELSGALKTLRVLGLISDRLYDEYNQRALNALGPTVTGSV